jgi:hypothetical protein
MKMQDVPFNPETAVERYGRTWHLSQPLDDGLHIIGKLGFARRSASSSVTYDTVKHDFVEVEAPLEQGNFVYYMLDIPSRILAFEERPPDIRRRSFLGALTAILREQRFRWDIDLLADEASFESWLTDVEKVTRYRASILRPNPSPIRHAREVRELVEETNADRLTIEATAGQDSSGLVVQDTILEATADHAADGNGNFKATGVKNGRRRFFDSLRRLRTRQLTLPPDATADELLTQLAEELASVVAEQQSEATDDNE